MTTNQSRLGCALAAATTLMLAACAGPSPSPPPPVAGGPAPDQVVPIDVEITGGQVRSAAQRVEVPLGRKVRLMVRSDRPDEVHVHGYDKSVPLRPGEPASTEFVADIPGVFEVELHESGLTLPSLAVR